MCAKVEYIHIDQYSGMSRATKLVAVKLLRRQSTSCCKYKYRCKYKSEKCGAYKASPSLLKTVLVGPAKDPLALGLCYEAGSKCLVQIGCSIDLIKATDKLFVTKISDLILEAFPAGFCRFLSKRAINQMISESVLLAICKVPRPWIL